ncbi:MAG: trypsin-like peptidase domain-containing protein [Anaerolineae bacterium]
MKTKRYFVAVALALLVLLPLFSPVAEALGRRDTQRLMKSVVQLIAADEGRGGRIIPKWSGSGTIISSDGLILTNCHVALPRAMYDNSDLDYDLLIVALTTRSDEPPQPTYIAEVVQYDPDLDLAVLRVSQTMDGTPVDAQELNLPAVSLGDSDALEIGDALYIFGYPGIGGETITFTSGNVSGFSSERGIRGRAWIKTDASVAGGNSGGAGINEQGELVGVPTQFGSGGNGAPVDCRPYGDTNGDGVIDEDDACIPLGGFINALRPVNLALPLIEAAGLGIGPQPTPTPGPTREPPPGRPSVSRLIFAPGVDDCDQPLTVVRSFPSDTEDIYLVFDYDNFQDGATWQPVLVYEGETYSDIWSPSNWEGDPKGTSWIGLHNEPLPDGTYQFLIYYEGEEIGSAEVQVGVTEPAGPVFSNIVFSGGSQQGCFLPAGIGEVKATFSHANATADTEWSYAWYYEGEQVLTGEGEPLSSGFGEGYLILSHRGGFEAGSYRLELFIEDTLAATADFFLGGRQQEKPFGPITFAEGVDRRDNPVRPGTTFRSDLKELYAFFDYQGMKDDWEFTRRWYVDGEAATEASVIWEFGESGKNFWVAISSQDGLPNGEYQLELLVEGELVQTGTCTVGSGPRPTPTPPPEGDVEIYGYITDAATGRGIRGAGFIVLQPGIMVEDFQWTDEEIYSWAETDRKGYYELSTPPLVRGETYSIIVIAEGYIPIAEDDIYIPEDIESPFELNIELQKVR